MRLYFAVSLALTFAPTFPARFSSLVLAAGDANTVIGGNAGHTPTAARPPIHPDSPSWYFTEPETSSPPIQHNVPPITNPAATARQRWEALLRLGVRLGEYGRDPRTLRPHMPLPSVATSHLHRLQSQLHHIVDQKRAVFIDVTPDRQGRLLGIPMPIDFAGTAQRKGWTIVGVYPAKEGSGPRVEWYMYASHAEPDPKELGIKLKDARDARTLRYFLSRPL